MIVDISLTEGHESHHLGRIYRSAGKDLLSGLCHYPLSGAVLYLSAYSDSLHLHRDRTEPFLFARETTETTGFYSIDISNCASEISWLFPNYFRDAERVSLI